MSGTTATLSTTIVATIVARQFPRLAPPRVTYMGAGEDSWAYEVNERWIFRFPKRAEIERQLLVERAILPQLAPSLGLPIPQFVFHGEPSAEHPFHFVGYERLGGVQALLVDPDRIAFDTLAVQLGPFLSALHSHPTAAAEACGAETLDLGAYVEESRLEALDGLDVVAQAAPELPVDEYRAYLARLAPLAPPPWALTIAHDDLASEHILVDESTSRVLGVIDWGDVAIADPTMDFVGLWAWGGERFVRAVLQHYHGPADARVIDRVRPLGIIRALGDIRFGIQQGVPAYVSQGVRTLRATRLQ